MAPRGGLIGLQQLGLLRSQGGQQGVFQAAFLLAERPAGAGEVYVQVVQEVKKYFADKVYATAIPRNVRLSEAPSFGQPVAYFDRSSKGAKAYEELAKEILEQHRQ